MERGLKFAAILPLTDFASARRTAERAEALGFHAIAAEDHFFMSSFGRERREPRLECFTVLSALAPLTSSITLTQVVTANSFRHPGLLAKIVTSLHQIAGGRVELGLGAGWFREEYDAFGLPYPKPSVRIAQMAEAIRIIKGLWRDPETTFQGEHYRLDAAPHEPKPHPRPRIMIGGGGEKLLRVTAREADIANIIPPSSGAIGRVDIKETLRFTFDDFRRRVDVLTAACREIGRDVDEIELSGTVFVLMGRTEAEVDNLVQLTGQALALEDPEAARHSPNTLVGTPEQCAEELRRRQRELGVTYCFCNFMGPDMIELFGTEVLPRLRAD